MTGSEIRLTAMISGSSDVPTCGAVADDDLGAGDFLGRRHGFVHRQPRGNCIVVPARKDLRRALTKLGTDRCVAADEDRAAVVVRRPPAFSRSIAYLRSWRRGVAREGAAQEPRAQLEGRTEVGRAPGGRDAWVSIPGEVVRVSPEVWRWPGPKASGRSERLQYLVRVAHRRRCVCVGGPDSRIEVEVDERFRDPLDCQIRQVGANFV